LGIDSVKEKINFGCGKLCCRLRRSMDFHLRQLYINSKKPGGGRAAEGFSLNINTALITAAFGIELT
jgi:hypothetical protein